MSRPRIRVLVVDDSAVLRELLADIIESDPQFTVVAKARDGYDALEKVESHEPDVVTLDVEMPRMDGLATLDALLSKNPIPVVMVSAVTTRDADVTLKALERGALDYISKPSSLKTANDEFRRHLLPKLKAIAGADVRRILRIRATKKQRHRARSTLSDQGRGACGLAHQYRNCCIAIGISTGGPPALSHLFESLAPPLPPIVIVQHMPANFTGAFAQRLDSLSMLNVKEATTGDRLEPNCAYVARGGSHLLLRVGPTHVTIRIKQGEPVSGHQPSVDMMMQSAAAAFGQRCLGIIMTGMGHDGVDGCRAVREAGGYVLGQNQATSDVYGMNRAAFAAGHVDEQFALSDLAALMSTKCRRLFGEGAKLKVK